MNNFDSEYFCWLTASCNVVSTKWCRSVHYTQWHNQYRRQQKTCSDDHWSQWSNRKCLCSIKIIEELLEFVNDSGSMINEFRQDKIRFKFSALRVKTFANMINCRCCVITTLHTSSLLLPLLHSHLLVPTQSEEQSWYLWTKILHPNCSSHTVQRLLEKTTRNSKQIQNQKPKY